MGLETVNLSLDAKLYRGAAGSTAATECTSCIDVSIKCKKSEIKISNRGSRWQLTKTGLKEAEFTVNFASNQSDTHLQAFIAAFVGDSAIACRMIPSVGGAGLDADFEVTSMDDSEKLEEVVMYSFTLKPTYVGRFPTWH